MISIEFFLFFILILLSAAVILLIVLLIRKRSVHSPAVMADINQKLDKLERLSTDFNDLSSLFLIPHTRGGIGETMLNELLSTWLPKKSYALQYSFQDGSRVDAVIKLGGYIVPVDAKFPLESLNRFITDEKQSGNQSKEISRIFLRYAGDISKKYIKPAEGTLDFALMYIPSEKIFYHSFVVGGGDSLNSCVRNGVVPVSPSALFLYLQTIVFGLKGFSLPGNQRQLIEYISGLRNDFTQLSKILSVTGTHLKNLKNAYDESISKLRQVENGIHRLENGSSEN